VIIKITSSNQHLADVLFKNPNTDFGLYLAPLKNGVIVGNLVSENEYHIVFQDKKYSYLPEESNAIDFQSYCSPLVILDSISTLFGHLLKSPDEYQQKQIDWLNHTQGEIDNLPCKIIVPNLYIHSSWAKENNFLLAKYFPQLIVKNVKGKNYSIELECKNIYEAINLLCVTSLFIHVTNEYGIYTFIDEYFAQKYARILTNIDKVPYFVFYLFIKKAIRKEEHFELIKPKFEDYLLNQGMRAELKYAYNLQERMHFIIKNIDTKFDVLDVGCGEFAYYKNLRKQFYFGKYVGIDEDTKFQEVYDRLQSQYSDENFEFHAQLDNIDKKTRYNIILSEVIEHNSMEAAAHLIQYLLGFDFCKIILTTPNADFNKYYGETLERRHDDHDFEIGAEGFMHFIKESCSHLDNLEMEWYGIGDKINGSSSTQAVIITKK
jgi:2-polyprenyl-3-methyl-5-hydroxy-6-metoxy-1,4-benzoquinol methylase